MRLLIWITLCVAGLLIAGIFWLTIAPPAIVRVASNYAAKIVCSNVFIAGRDGQEVLAVDVQAPGHPLLRGINIEVDRDAGEVRAGLFGRFGKGLAVHQPGNGCTALPDGDRDALVPMPPRAANIVTQDAPWPRGDVVDFAASGPIEAVLDNAALTGEGLRAIVVVKDGRIIAEKYADGFSAQTPLLGWSMTKTVTAALLGRMQKDGTLAQDPDNLFPQWAGDMRARIRLSDMLGMASDLAWNEGYGAVSDVTRMLYLEPDMAAFVAALPLNAADGSKTGATFEYSSGTTVLLSAYWQALLGDRAKAAAYPYAALFEPLGMSSAVLEADGRGTFAGSSYLYATARDWARFGQFLLQDGRWNNVELLPPGYVDWMVKTHPASDGHYGQGHVWKRQPGLEEDEEDPGFPHPVFWLAGHDGQSVAVLPDNDMVVVRMGLTPSNRKYRPAELAEALVKAAGD